MYSAQRWSVDIVQKRIFSCDLLNVVYERKINPERKLRHWRKRCDACKCLSSHYYNWKNVPYKFIFKELYEDDDCRVQAGDPFNTKGVQTTPTLTFSHAHSKRILTYSATQFNNIHHLLLQLKIQHLNYNTSPW